MMARSSKAPSIGRIQKRKTNFSKSSLFGLQRAAGPYKCRHVGFTPDSGRRAATQRTDASGQIQTSKPGADTECPVLLRSETNDPSKSACFLLIMVGWRPTYAASSLDSATSENRQSAADMKYRHTLRNCAGDRRMIDTAYELATREPSACRRDRFSDGEPATLCRGSVHAIK